MDTSIFRSEASFPDENAVLSFSAEESAATRSGLRPGDFIQGKYCVRGVLGYGGFAVVYDAEHVGLARAVAIKVLHIGPDTPLALIERFRREARISALVHHANVLDVYDTGQLVDGSPFLVMERVNGENLSALIRRGPLSIAMTVEVGRQLLLGLGAIAEAGIVHRDIKPDNIMLHDAGDGTPIVKLVDFGISKHVSIEPHARLTCHGALIGTPQYMSPEQIRGEDVDVRTDIYAVGAVLYESLTGRAPHQSKNFSELVVAILNSPARPLSELRGNCPFELDRIVLSALERARSRRFPSPREFLQALEDFACAFDLPCGADAFRACDQEASLQRSALRSSTVGVSSFFGLQQPRKRALQVALIALALSAPSAGKILRAHRTPQSDTGGTVAAAVEGAHATPRAQILMSGVGGTMASAAPLALRVVEAALPDTKGEASPPPVEAAPTQLEPAPSPRARATRRPEVDARAPTSAWIAPTAASAAPPPVPAARSHPDSVEAAQLVVDAPEQLSAPAALTAEERAAWDQTMQQALAALVRGQLAAAKSSYARAVRIAPREPAGFRGLGLVAARLGDSREARGSLKRYLALAPRAADGSLVAARIAALPN